MSVFDRVAVQLACLTAAALIAGCVSESADTTDSPDRPGARSGGTASLSAEARIEPIPPIPAALRGCWATDGPDDPEEPGGPHRLVVTATTIELLGEGMPRRVATAEFVERVTPTSIEGRFSAPDNHGRATVATALMLGDGGDTGPVGQLRRAEGDAGSDFYRRCPE